MTTGRPTVLVAGNGMVGFRFCRELVARAPGRFRIVVFGEEDRPAYDRVHLSQLFDNRRLDDLALASRAWYERNDIELHLGDPIESIDRPKSRVLSHSGRQVHYDTLILATGAAPVIPDIPGIDLAEVHVYRNAADLLAIRVQARRAGSAAVLGGGLLGLEVAAALVRLGLETTVVEPAPHLMPRQLDPLSADLLQSEVERLGVQVVTGVRPRSIRSRLGLQVVELEVATPLAVDFVVVAAGVKPRDELARSAGLVIDEDGGVEIDDRVATSDPQILAIGDCARHAGVTYGLVGPGYEMARVAAERLATGLRAPSVRFAGADRSCRLAVAGVEVAALGDYDGGGRQLAFEASGVRRTMVLRGGSIVGARSVGPWPELGEVEMAIASERRLSAQEIDRFCRTGTPFTAARGSERWPDSALACRCARVTCGSIRAEVAAGCSSLVQLGAKTGAGTVCGSCRPALAQLCGGATTRPKHHIRPGLIAASLAALAGFVGFLVAAPLEIGGGPVSEWLAQFWLRGGYKMASGFVLAGTAAVSLIMIVLRRARRARRKSLLLTTVHSFIGVLAIAVLVAHTGLHAGDNLNRALLTAFLGVIVTGGAVGLASLASVSRARPVLLWSHRILLGALPVLLAFHIVAVFYF
jgi:nitrite reductase (NADH) large subunit